MECCDTLYNGVPYGSNLNHGHKVQVGIDIVNGLSRRYNLSMPLLVDNRESVNQLPPTNAQVISLSVSQRDSGLRPEQDTSIQPLEHQPAWLEASAPMPLVTENVLAASASVSAIAGPDF